MLKNKVMLSLILALGASTLVTSSSPTLAEEKIEGTVVKTNLTSCSVVPGKVGTCEGTLVLETKKEGKPHQSTVKITRDTALKRGDEKVFLFQLQGAQVAISLMTEKGEQVAKSVVVKR